MSRGRRNSHLVRNAILGWIVLIILAVTFSIVKEAGYITITLICSAVCYGAGRASKRAIPQHASKLPGEPTVITGSTERADIPDDITHESYAWGPEGHSTNRHNLLSDPRSGATPLFPEEE